MEWKFQQWRPTPALIERKGGAQVQYVGQKYDPTYFELVEDGWTHDHCEICFHTLSDIEGYGDPDGYKTENGDWICNNCYNLFVKPVDVQETINSLPSSLK